MPPRPRHAWQHLRRRDPGGAGPSEEARSTPEAAQRPLRDQPRSDCFVLGGNIISNKTRLHNIYMYIYAYVYM